MTAIGNGAITGQAPAADQLRARREAEADAARAAKQSVRTDGFASEPAAAEADAAAADTLDKVEVSGARLARFGDQPIDDEPPASADSPDVRKAWLRRVRELLDDGRRDDAGASLREYHRRYPDAKIPDDLRGLLGE